MSGGQAAGDACPRSPVLLRADRLGLAYPGQRLLHDLSFEIRPGLTLVRGGDGRGKSTLLRLLAGEQTPSSGAVHRHAQPVFWWVAANPDDDACVGHDWLRAMRDRFATWDDALARSLLERFGLGEHAGKPLFMLSTGSRRKLGLTAAAASRAPLTLIDMPFAALDGPSCRVVSELLIAAAAGRDRGWVVADHEQPPSLAGVRLAATIDLGD